MLFSICCLDRRAWHHGLRLIGDENAERARVGLRAHLGREHQRCDDECRGCRQQPDMNERNESGHGILQVHGARLRRAAESRITVASRRDDAVTSAQTRCDESRRAGLHDQPHREVESPFDGAVQAHSPDTATARAAGDPCGSPRPCRFCCRPLPDGGPAIAADCRETLSHSPEPLLAAFVLLCSAPPSHRCGKERIA